MAPAPKATPVTPQSRADAYAGLDACLDACDAAFGTDPAYAGWLDALASHIETARMFVDQMHDNTPYRLAPPA